MSFTRISAGDCCTSATSDVLLHTAPQPISNRFRTSPGEAEAKYSLELSQCRKTGLIYLSDGAPQLELVPRVDWLTYNEPEGHLDQMVEQLAAHCQLVSGDVVGAISSKDDTTLDRFAKLNCRVWRLALAEDIGITQAGVGVESIQQALDSRLAAQAAASHGRAKVLIVRHILEHVYDLPRFVSALRELVEPNGFIVFEVPDCTLAFERQDYTTLWEEHTLYFTKFTLMSLLAMHNFPVSFFHTYPYPFESSLVAVARNVPVLEDSSKQLITGAEDEQTLAVELDRGRRFADGFSQTRSLAHQVLKEFRDRGQLAIFGAGHLASTFLALFELASYFSFVIDDNPHKVGSLLPGTELPICPSSILSDEQLALCLIGLNPMNEDKIVKTFSPQLTGSGGEFRSIFPVSRRFLLGDCA